MDIVKLTVDLQSWQRESRYERREHGRPIPAYAVVYVFRPIGLDGDVRLEKRVEGNLLCLSIERTFSRARARRIHKSLRSAGFEQRADGLVLFRYIVFAEGWSEERLADVQRRTFDRLTGGRKPHTILGGSPSPLERR